MSDIAISPIKAIRKVMREHGRITLYNNKYTKSRSIKAYAGGKIANMRLATDLRDLMEQYGIREVSNPSKQSGFSIKFANVTTNRPSWMPDAFIIRLSKDVLGK